MINEKLLRKYAKVAVCSGANIQPGQLLVISAAARDYQFVEYCVEEAYKAKAGYVKVNWSDEVITKLSYINCDLETLKEFPQWKYDERKWQQDKGCAYLHIVSDTPGYMSDVDQNKIRETQMAIMKAIKDLRHYSMANYGQWSIVALPSLGWAKKVFPNENDEKAVELLWDAILKSVRISEDNDPVQEWINHSNELKHHCEVMNKHSFAKLHFTSELGTDLTVGLVDKHLWAGGCSPVTGKEEIEFNPNMPTEEIFCMPHRDKVDGIVYASKPLSYAGSVVSDFWFKFENGKVVDYGAKEGKEALTTLLETDEGAKHLGEVALISYHSPISLMNILFYETLFDENASCHLALGACYPENIEGGLEMSEEELMKHGGNNSMEHCDFMFGTKNMKVVGIKDDGCETIVFENGDFAF